MKGDHRSLDGLTGLRAVAAVWVIAFHYRTGPFSPLGANHVLPILGYGYLGVDMFFILSGFVIWHVHAEDFVRPRLRAFLRFMALRAARLYPVYLVTLGVFVVLLWLAPDWGATPLYPGNYTGGQFLQHLLLVQSWGFSAHLSWNYPSWSVSAEWFCYILFPLAAPVMASFGRRGVTLAIALLLVGIGASYWVAFNANLNHSVGAVTLLRAAPEFALGCLLRQLAGTTAMETWPWTRIVGGVALLWVASFYTPLPVGLLAIPLFAMMILAASVSGTMVARVVSLRPFVALGAASYSLYLMQAPVQKGASVLKQWLDPARPFQSAGVVVAYLSLLAAGTFIVHRFAENPSRRFLRRLIDRWMPKGVAPAQTDSGLELARARSGRAISPDAQVAFRNSGEGRTQL